MIYFWLRLLETGITQGKFHNDWLIIEQSIKACDTFLPFILIYAEEDGGFPAVLIINF